MALLLTAEVNAALIAALTARTALTALSIETIPLSATALKNAATGYKKSENGHRYAHK